MTTEALNAMPWYETWEKLLAERTAFVSGSGQNIGRAVAVRLAELGCNVVVNGATNESACRETAELVERAGGKVLDRDGRRRPARDDFADVKSRS